MDKKVENMLFIVIGAILLIVVELKLVYLTEILLLVLGFMGFAALLNGAFGFYNIYRKDSNDI